MCYSGCPYERWDGECSSSRPPLTKGQPHCLEEVEYFEALAAREDMLCDRQDYEEARQHGF